LARLAVAALGGALALRWGHGLTPIFIAQGVGLVIYALINANAVSKAAAWSLTNGLRNELRQQGTQVLGLHVGFVDTDLARGLDVVKVSPQSVVITAFDALEAGASEVLADERARTVKRGLTAEPVIYL
jgi:short-subunit dehydrogenase